MSWPTRSFFEEALDEPAMMIRELRKILPAVHTEALWEHFGRPEAYWSCGGHILYFDKGRVTDRALRFLQDIEVIA
ncbi:MAG: hypothetical protein JRF55_18050 [Deltaproteobacteria bacterium]|nr:hypothetical protein [Deltaproteobacteria bacterium]